MTDLDALKRNTNIITILTGYGVELIQKGNQYSCKCIWHDDHNPSMSVFEGDDGIWRVHCHSACGKTGTVIDVVKEFECCDEGEAIKRLEANHFVRNDHRIIPEKPIKPNAWTSMKPPSPYFEFDLPNLKYVAHWEYKDAQGDTLGYVVRYEDASGEKDYRPWTYGRMSANVEPSWRCKVWSPIRPLYGLDKLAAKPNSRVVLCEGEKAADAAQKLLPNMVCMAWPGGSNAVKKIDWNPLAGKNILLVPDADIAGELAMKAAAGYLLALGCTVRYLDTSDQGHMQGWDLADALADGWRTDDVVTFCENRISPLTSREIEKWTLEQEKKTVQNEAIEGEFSPVIESPKIIEIPEQLPPNVTPIKPHTAIKESMNVPDGDPFSDVRMAEIWAQNEGEDWRYCFKWEKWLRWNGNLWELDTCRSANKIVAKELKRANYWVEASQLSVKDKRALCSVGKITAVLKHAATELPTLPEQWDADPWLLGTPEGVVDLKTGKLRESRREDYITKQTKVAPKAGPHPTWDSVLKRCTKGSQAVADYYQRWWGYMLTGSCKEEAFLMVHGPGASGKTKFLGVADILGDYMTECDIAMLMESKNERHSSEMAALAGARIVRTTEPEEGSRWNESILKKITGREKIPARRLYEEMFTFEVQFKIVLGSNFRPSLKSTGEEIRRRLHFVEFPSSIPEAERDFDLDAKLAQEYPAILQWMIDGCMEWQRIGLAKPDSVIKDTQGYLNEEDTLGRWLDECCTIDSMLKVSSGAAYKSYSEFIQRHGEGIVSQKRFTQRMESRGFKPGRSSHGRHIEGLDIVPAAPTGWSAPDDF